MWEHWITNYGFIALFLGAMLEGEAVLILAGYSVARGYLPPLPTFFVAVAGAATADSFYFWLGRRFGAKLIRSFRRLRPLRARATLFVRRKGHAAVFLARFAYGLRFVLPTIMGAIRIRPGIFHPFALLAAFCFAALYLTIGYVFGQAIEEFLIRVHGWETAFFTGMLILGVLALVVRQWRLYHSSPE
jgi:membrane protein DedA with SNARE-associated domain